MEKTCREEAAQVLSQLCVQVRVLTEKHEWTQEVAAAAEANADKIRVRHFAAPAHALCRLACLRQASVCSCPDHSCMSTTGLLLWCSPIRTGSNAASQSC